MNPDLAPQRLLAAYASGIFPMADENGELIWLSPDPRTIFELDGLKISRSLRAAVKQNRFQITVDQEFNDVINACADRSEGTWISQQIKEAYGNLHALGFAHSVESRINGELVGGLYGVSIGGAFFGESMFSKVTDASKVALVKLVDHMISRNLVLLDVQFQTDHLRSLGAVEIPRSDYLRRLEHAVHLPCSFVTPPDQALTDQGS